MSTVGTPWPDAVHGEVHSPSGRRAYLAADAAALAGKSTKWATELARSGAVDSETGLIAGRSGGRPAWFLLADSLEAHLAGEPSGPSQGSVEPQTDLAHLLQLQGADLEAERQTVAQLRAENAALTDMLAQRDARIAQLAMMVAEMAVPTPPKP
ncbi:hypothetical protein P5V93_23295 [Mycobacteroides abscessus subsp. abscessus]|uniref:hypothetical protein n=1 Tax=Mycobacteroides abscessus TaxID=36809 RepID=UPI00037C774F|nr:hypothetical protein [Mycobacteroides abscessus]MDO3101047.1 hypothetical protein [Mycobacteroides abscessus subsp. abscessus]MDO3185010.1 hypothetical protein [Mycobacteroides abscessus subsp. abscessus]MDO3194367.1 hypothetical protein [Mycobacteroides abscessus subsp. abscessus]MDO3287438.1 hypothetical protein [Mycobacteroides abscessus subsp. abscessus]OLT84732.1 hypothetical protein BKG58_15835 [Mycobacteroides abscessus subsp. abscessus]